MSEKIVQLNEEMIKGQIRELVRGSVEETLNELLEKEAESLTQAARYERNEARQGYRSGHDDRNLTTTSGDVTLHMPRLKGVSFETAIIERYRRRESSVEEALIVNRPSLLSSKVWDSSYPYLSPSFNKDTNISSIVSRFKLSLMLIAYHLPLLYISFIIFRLYFIVKTFFVIYC